MTPDLAARIQQILGSAYTIERELGGGGMSRVFVAQDTALGRRVVVKVLPPEMSAAVNTERFRREIQLAAQLQHPHIVPLLSAGTGSGAAATGGADTLYYTMPFIEGETLRGLLARRRELPIGEAVRMLREIADALAYAHERGIVHRDIKPENILLTTGHALVADFGIARALSAATDPTSLTSAGMAVGTPAYMAPEQAAADPLTDHRADLYALGVVAYEMLVGQPPFMGMSPQQMFVAHAMTQPEPIQSRRAAVPPQLAALVMRLLEKRPSDRPQSAAEVVQALDAIVSGTGAVAAPHLATAGARSRAKRIAALALALTLTLVLALKFWPSRASQPLDANLIVVAPFRVTGDASLAYLREGMLDLLAAKITGEGGPRAGDPRTLLKAWQQRAGGSDKDLEQRDAIALAQHLGAGQLLLGAVTATGPEITLTAKLIRVPSGAAGPGATIVGVADSLGVLVDRLAAELLAKSTGQAEALGGSVARTALPVLRLYLDGMANYRRGRYPEAQQSLGRALAMDTNFVPAALSLIMINGHHPIDDDAAWDVVEREYPRMSERDSMSIEARRRFVDDTSSFASVIEAAADYAAIAPDRAEAWTDLAGWLWMYGPLAGIVDYRERAASAFARSLELDPDFAETVRGAMMSAAKFGDTATVRALWTRYQKIAGDALEFEFIRYKVAHALRDSATIIAVRARFATLPPRDLLRLLEYMMVDNVGLSDAPAVLRALEARAVDEYDIDRGRLAASSFLRNGGRDEEVPIRFRGSEDRPFVEWKRLSDALIWDGDTVLGAAAANYFAGALRGSQPDPEYDDRPDFGCLASMWHLTRRDTTIALPLIRRARELRGAGPVRDKYVERTICFLTVDALQENARGTNSTVALARLDSAIATGHENTQMGSLIAARLHEAKGNLPAALTAVRRRTSHGRDGPRALTTMLREEGRLAALTGDTTGAIRAYRHFLALRPNPAERLRADTERIRGELARLEGSQRR